MQIIKMRPAGSELLVYSVSEAPFPGKKKLWGEAYSAWLTCSLFEAQ
jgi:hypothetical protein